MKMKKLMSLCLACLMGVSVFAGCTKDTKETATDGGSSAPATKTEKKTEESKEVKKTVVKWWTYNRHDMDFMLERIEQYNKENTDNIEVEYTIHSENYQQSLELATESNEAPDIFTPGQGIKYYVERNMVTPLDDYLTEDLRTYIGETNFVQTVNTVDGVVYSLPNTGSVFRLVYNQDLFDRAGITKVPETMDEVVEAAKIITDKYKSEGIYGYGFNLKAAYGGLFRSMDPVAQKSGISEYNYQTGEYDFEAYRPVIESFKRLFDNGSVFPGYESMSTDPMRAQFAQGKIAMYMSAEWEIGVYNKQFPTEINWKAAPIPYIGDAPKSISNIRGGYWTAIHANSENKDAAFKVLEYMYNSGTLKEYHEKSLGFSLLPGVIKEAKTPELPGSEYFVRSKYDGYWPAKPDTLGLKLEGKNYWEEIVAVFMGMKTTDEIIPELDARYKKALDKAVENKKEQRYILEDFDPSSLLED